LEKADAIVANHGIIATTRTTIVPEITTRIMIAQRIPGFWARSKIQCTLKNGENDEEFNKATLMQALARVAMGGILKSEPTKGHCD